MWRREVLYIYGPRTTQAARSDVPGADTIYDDLKERFPGVAGDPEEEEQEPPPGS